MSIEWVQPFPRGTRNPDAVPDLVPGAAARVDGQAVQLPGPAQRSRVEWWSLGWAEHGWRLTQMQEMAVGFSTASWCRGPAVRSGSNGTPSTQGNPDTG